MNMFGNSVDYDYDDWGKVLYDKKGNFCFLCLMELKEGLNVGLKEDLNVGLREELNFLKFFL